MKTSKKIKSKKSYASVSPWNYYLEESRGREVYSVKRAVVKKNGLRSWERYNRENYKRFENDPEEIHKLVVRLNGRDHREEKAKEKWGIEHAFISSKLLMKFNDQLKSYNNSEKEANKYYNYFRKYFLNFFLKLSPDPLEWHRKYQLHWREALKNPNKLFLIEENQRIFKKGKLYSERVLNDTIRHANKFMQLLHQEMPEEVPELTFRPFKNGEIKKIENERKLKDLVREGKYIPYEDRQVILSNLPQDIEAPTVLADKFKLRQAESLGFYKKEKKIKKGYLEVSEQLKTYNKEKGPSYGPLKGNKIVKHPYWNSNHQEVYELIQKIVPMHPHTLCDKFSAYADDLYRNGLVSDVYRFKDLRATCITDDLENHTLEEVRLSAGHSSSKTTEKHYIKDKRQLDDEVWTPA